MNPTAYSRRSFLRQSALGFGSLALTALASASPLSPKRPHFAPRANRVILLFMEGGASHVDLIDYKPEIFRRHGQVLSPEMMPKLWREGKGESPDDFGPIMATPVKFSRHGQSGHWMSDAMPNVARHADKLCVVNSMVCDSPEHGTAVQQFHTGSFTPRPSMGAWITYGLGSENQNLPGFIVISPPAGSNANCGSDFLPALFQATILRDGESRERIRYLGDQANEPILDLLRQINRDHAERVGNDARLESLAASHELAFRMQREAPTLFDLRGESEQTLSLYGIDRPDTSSFGKQCLLARRMAEAGVRFIQVTSKGWDHHGSIYSSLTRSCARVDQPIAGLLADLAQRGLLDDTLVIWSGEFGRTPLVQGVKGKNEINFAALGRGHNPYGWSLWLAGGGIKAGYRHGATDPFGFQSVENRVHIHDLHATILHLLGLDHERLTFRHAGRDFRLTDVYGNVVSELLA